MTAAREFQDDVQIPKAEIHVTEACNNRCAFCATGWANAEQRGQQHVPREVIRAHLREAWAGGARRVLYQGGEPTLRTDLPGLVADAREAGFPVVSVFTNARLAAARVGCERLVGAKVSWFQVSIQGGDARAHDASVVAPGAFAQTVAGTRALLARGQRVKVNAVLTPELLASLPAFARLLAELHPEEVAIDTVKPTGAFGPGRAEYAALAPALGPHAPALRDTVLLLHQAGLVVRLTSLPPCLVPGAEAWISEEAPTTLTRQTSGEVVAKHDWKRSLQVKAPACASCAYDAVCGGVYRPYAEAHGVAELRPLAARVPGAPVPAAAQASGLTGRLRGFFVQPQPAPITVRAVEALPAGEHRLECVGPRGTVFVRVRPRDAGRSYAVTERFAVTWDRPASGPPPDLRVVDAVVRGLRKLEPQLSPADLASGERAAPAASQTVIDVPSVCERACAFCHVSTHPRAGRRPRGDDEQVLRAIGEAGRRTLGAQPSDSAGGDGARPHPPGGQPAERAGSGTAGDGARPHPPGGQPAERAGSGTAGDGARSQPQRAEPADRAGDGARSQPQGGHPADGAGEVLFTGDDALSHPRLGEFIERAARRGARVTVIGPPRLGATAPRLPALAAAGLGAWTTALLGAERRTHDQRAGLEGAWDALHQAAAAARAAGLTVDLVTPLIVPVLDELPALAALARSMSPHPLTLLSYAPDSMVGTRFDALVPPFDALRAALERLAASPAAAGVRVDAAPLCVLPPAWREGAGTRVERTDAALTARWPAEPCEGCAARQRCPGVMDTVLRAVGARGLTPGRPAGGTSPARRP